MTRKERAIEMLNSGKIELDTFGQLAIHNFSDEIIARAIERKWISSEVAEQLA